MLDKKEITVYWSPGLHIKDDRVIDGSFLYPNPESLFLDKAKNKSKLSAPRESFFSCPAVSKKMKNTFVFSNALESSFYFDFTDPDKQIIENSPNSLDISILRQPTLNTGPCLSINLSYMFFADEPVDAFFTPPYFHEPKYTKYGSVIPGEFNVGQWFRPFNIDLQMWKNKENFFIEDGEPLFYVEFKTDKKIKFKQFNMNRQLNDYALSCIDTTNIFGFGQTLQSRYDRFKKVRMRDKILTEINKNIID